MNYFVVVYGHIAWFEQYEAALTFARDFNGVHFNYWGLVLAAEPDTSDIPETDEYWFRNAKIKNYGTTHHRKEEPYP